MHARCRVFLLGQCLERCLWPLWTGQQDLHTFHRKLSPPLIPVLASEHPLQSPIRRYADVLAHRQLAASINYTPLHPSLQSKSHVDKTLNVVNKRHRLAQMAGRASVEFYVGLALKSRNQGRSIEEAFVIRTFRNGLAVFVSKLGLEGLITFKKDSHAFDPENYSISIPRADDAGQVTVSVFDKITVEVGIEKDPNTQRGKVKMVMLEPVNSGNL